MIEARADALVVFGITGDLAAKMVIRSLYNLATSDRLPPIVVGVAFTDWDTEQLRDHVKTTLSNAKVEVSEAPLDRLLGSLRYVSGDYRNAETYEKVKTELGDTELPVFYLAIPPGLFDDVAEGLAAVGLNRTSRVVLEKPFGRDLASAHELNQILHRHFPEDRIYRIDHFLGKDPVQNLMVFRFANTIFEPVWNRHYIDSVQITMSESFGVEGRGGFYDGVGTLRDVVQNHLLQIMGLLAMEPPVSEAPNAVRDERVKVFTAIKPLRPDDLVRGQFEGYLDEPGVAPDSDTETYVALRAEIDSWRWAGVPWYIRAGKGMAETVTEALIKFKEPPRLFFADPACEPHPNVLRMRMKPDSAITLELQSKRPGDAMLSDSVALQIPSAEVSSSNDAYERLLDDAMDGDARLFGRQDGVEASWRIFDPILEDHHPVETYARGSWGPAGAAELNPDWHNATDGDC